MGNDMEKGKEPVREILQVRDLAAIFGVSEDAIRKRFQRGDFGRCAKIGRKWVLTRSRLFALIECASK